MIKKLPKENLAKFVAKLNKKYPVHRPVKTRKGLFDFQKALDFKFAQLKLDYPLTQLPPTKYLLPFREKIMKMNKKGNYQHLKNKTPLTIYGLEGYDMKAINRLDKIMKDDPYYNSRRENTILVAISDRPTNFLDRVLSGERLTDFDLLFKDGGDHYLLITGSKKGEQIVKSDLLKTTNLKLSPRKSQNQSQNLKKISWAVEKTKDHKMWDYWADKCLGCGNCAYVCPLCYCYQLEDRPKIDGTIYRYRQRSNCLHYNFNQMSGGNPKENFRDRFYHWYYHKFVAMPQEYGFSGCVNCGRCIKACPADINFRKILNQAIEITENE